MVGSLLGCIVMDALCHVLCIGFFQFRYIFSTLDNELTSTNNNTKVKTSTNSELSSNHTRIERANDGDVLNRVWRMILADTFFFKCMQLIKYEQFLSALVSKRV